MGKLRPLEGSISTLGHRTRQWEESWGCLSLLVPRQTTLPSATSQPAGGFLTSAPVSVTPLILQLVSDMMLIVDNHVPCQEPQVLGTVTSEPSRCGGGGAVYGAAKDEPRLGKLSWIVKLKLAGCQSCLFRPVSCPHFMAVIRTHRSQQNHSTYTPN